MTGHGAPVIPRPRQAVILAEDRGEHLGGLTVSCPKAMVEFHGRPFLDYLIELLREQEFTDALIMLGALPDVVRDYFRDGLASGVRITYSVTAAADQTVPHFHAVRHLIQEHFLLLRADNYWPMLFDRMWSQYVAAGVPGLATVYANKDGYAADNVRICPDGLIELYDQFGATPGLKGAEVGYAILHRDVLDLLPQQGTQVEEALYPVLANRRHLAAHMTEHRYYGLESAERLTLTDIFLARKPAVILDRDGVLNRRPPPGEYIRSLADFEWLPGALDALRAFRQAGYTVIVASNQAGLARGQVSVEALEAIHSTMRAQALAAGGGIDAIYHCPHDWYAGCDCRKPRPGLLFQAQRDFALDLTRTCVLGDDESDMRCAEAAGAQGRLVTVDEPLIAHAHRLIQSSDRA